MVNKSASTDYDAMQRLIAAIQAMPPVQIEFDPGTLLGLIGTLQLALRHPAFKSRTATAMRDLVERLKGCFPPEVRPLLDRGDDPAFDV